MNKLDNKATIESGKEIFRLVFFWIIATIVTALIEQIGSFNFPPYVAEILTGLLRAIDKWIHENDSIKLKGLSPL